MSNQNKADKASSISAPFIEYFSTFSELSKVNNSYQEFSTGVTLIELFCLIKEFELKGVSEDHVRGFSHKFSNFKILLQSIEEYWNTNLNSEIDASQIDLVQICHTGCQTQLDKLFSLFVKTAAQSSNKEFFIEKILKTSRQTQQFLKGIIEKTISNENKESPRKQKEKRMLDHLMQLDHQNQKLQQIISQVQEEKEQLEMKLKSRSEELSEKTIQVLRLRSCLSEEVSTPQKKRLPHIPDTNDRKDSQIDSLRHQIIEMNANHERQIQQCLSEMEKLSQKALQYEKVKQELEYSLSFIQSNQAEIEKARSIEHSLRQYKAECMDKDNVIKVAQEQLHKYESRFLEMERTQMQLRADLQRKNIQMIEMTTKFQRNSPKKMASHHNLFLQFPDIANTEADVYIETNRTLRQQLERSKHALQITASQLDTAHLKIQQLSKCDQENKKLRELLIEQKSYKGEQIDVLVHALYHLRKQVKQGDPAQRPLQAKNR